MNPDTTHAEPVDVTINRLERELIEKTNEVARLREALELIAKDTEAHRTGYYRTLAQAALLKDRSATEPEEPVNPTCSNTTHKFRHCDCPEPAPEWRELGEDETIYEGDEIHIEYNRWSPVGGYETFETPRRLKRRFRTRRPLPPVVDQSQSKWFKEGAKQEEMPLEDEIKRIEWHQNYSDAMIHHAIADAIRYLRDEIAKLNEAR